MVSCYDCERFGIGCSGMIPPIPFRDTIGDYCAMFQIVQWRHELYKSAGCSRI